MQATRPRFGEGDHRDLPEWQEAARFASAVEELSQALELPSELEWLRFLLGRSGSAIALLIEQAWQSEFLGGVLAGAL